MTSPAVQFPEIAGRTLQGEDVTLPHAFAGARNVVIVAFEQRHQAAVDSWVPWLEAQAGDHPGLRFYELPTIARRWAPFRPFIDGGMARAIQVPEILERTITVYGDRRAVTGPLGIDDLSEISVFLVDADGTVRWRGTGSFDPDVAEELVAAIREP